jgi:four helix bundle protein
VRREGFMATFRDLKVWQKSKEMVKPVYVLSAKFPAQERYGLTNQLRRCAVSIPSNIAEGYGRRSDVDFMRFLRIACGSLYELETQLEIAIDLGYASKSDCNSIFAGVNEIEKMLSVFIRKLNERNENKR